MPFHPPRCPHPDCVEHAQPSPRFFDRWGSYQPKCRTEPVPRFRCRSCGRTFSLQTFRPDYRDRRPDANEPLLCFSSSGVGMRQIGRQLGLSVFGVQYKTRKLARHLGRLHDQVVQRLPAGRRFVFDEEETFESASTRPLTVPLAVECDSWLIVSWEVGPIRRLARAGSRRRRRQERDEQRRGRREDESRRCVADLLRDLGRRVPEGSMTIVTDKKPAYVPLVREVLGERAEHQRFSGKAPRTKWNALFPINTTIAMSRDNCGRLRRKSWLVSKTAEGLRLQMAIWAVYRNFVRRRFNRDPSDRCPGAVLGLVPRSLRWGEILRWRQDWGALSPSPLCPAGRELVGSMSRCG